MIGSDIYINPFPVPWFVADLVVYVLAVITFIYIIKKSNRPEIILLESLAFIFIYAGTYENAMGVRSLYDFGRSMLTYGYVPLSIPAIEVLVLITGLWMLDKMRLPKWLQPLILSLFGFIQDLTLDPLSVSQVFTVGGVTSSRWNWIIGPDAVTIFNVPVYNFPGWSIIMLYSSAMILLGRYIYKKLKYKKIVGYIYPFIGMVMALLLMYSPLSRFLLWLEPFGKVQTNAEWVTFFAWIIIPVLLLIFIWRGRMTGSLSFKEELPIFLVPAAMHITDIIFTIYGSYWEILPFSIIISAVHILFLCFVFYLGRKTSPSEETKFSLII